MNTISNSLPAAQTALSQTPTTNAGGASGAGSFKDMLLDSIQEVNSMQQQADQAVETLMTGGDANPAEVMTAVQKADLAFRLMMQMRNKMMQVYQEVKDIRV